MSDEIQGKPRFLTHVDCPSCGGSMSVKLSLGSNEDGFLHVWHEGWCTHCNSNLVTPLQEVILIMDESSYQILAN